MKATNKNFDVNKTENNTVVFDFDFGGTELNLEIGKTTYSYYIKRKDEATEYGVGNLPI